MKISTFSVFLAIALLVLAASEIFCDPEFLVNTFTDYEQSTPSVGIDGNGNFVVTWVSAEPENEANHDIFAQRFDNDGNPIGDEFQVNTIVERDQYDPEIAMNPDGDFIVVWTSREQDGDGRGVFAKAYDSSGNVKKEDFQVNDYTEGDQQNPSVVMDSDGDFVIAWNSEDQDGEMGGIYAQIYDSNGNVVKPEFLANSHTENDQFGPSIAMDSNGDFVIAWTGVDQDDGRGIYAKTFDSGGNIKKEEFQVNQYTEDNQLNTSVAMAPDGNFAITWRSNGQDGSGYGIYACLYDSSANLIKEEFQVNSYTENNQSWSSVGMDSEGNFVITWSSNGQDGSNYGVFAQMFDRSGEPAGREFQVNTYATNSQNNPSISINDVGDYVITYSSNNQHSEDSGNDVYARMFDIANTPPEDIIPPAVEIMYPVNDDFVYGKIDILVKTIDESGIQSVLIEINDAGWFQCLFSGKYWQYSLDTQTILGDRLELVARVVDASDNENRTYSEKVVARVIDSSEFDEIRVNTTLLGSQESPSVAMDRMGNYVVAWESDNGIFARRFDATGSLLQADEFLVSNDTSSSDPSVAMDAEGNFVVVWSGEYITVKLINNLGFPSPDEFEIGDGGDPVVAMNNSGNFVVAWNTQDGTSAQRFGPEGNALSNEFIVFPNSNSLEQSVAIQDNGSFVIVGVVMSEAGTKSDIQAKLYDREGNPIGSEFQVNTHEELWKFRPSVAMNADGDFVVAWHSVVQDGSGTGVYARHFDRSGIPAGDEFRVNSVHWENQTNPTVAMDDDGDFVVVWDNWYMAGEKRNVFARLYDNTGEPVDEFQVNSDILATNIEVLPAVAMDADGDFVVAWQNRNDVYARYYEFEAFDTTPPQVEIISPLDGSWLSGTVQIHVSARDESSLYFVQIQINEGDWQLCLLTEEGYWRSDFDASSYIEDTELTINARAIDNTPNFNVGYSHPVSLIIKHPQVHLYYTGSIWQSGDVLNIKVNVLNTMQYNLDLYVSCYIPDHYFWYPEWGENQQSTRIERGIWDEVVLSIPYIFRPSGTYTFYADLVEPGSLMSLASDYITIKFD